ncbi:hypothetical protein MTR_4g066120 [Medicago truncatula]|uniref:Uncharacterized protein n=1 Tax=Medicago truncatula TaxID=3880 RepID=A0A072UKJ3_MEDTR|nr:hypothetical protein MTR_4g066120 [Medicago truncatula]
MAMWQTNDDMATCDVLFTNLLQLIKIPTALFRLIKLPTNLLSSLRKARKEIRRKLDEWKESRRNFDEWKEIRNKFYERYMSYISKNTIAEVRVKDKEKALKGVKPGPKEIVDSENKNKFISADSEANVSVSMNVPDSDFHDFNGD